MTIADTTPSAQALQRQIQRAMTGEQRLLMALEMSIFVRQLQQARLRREHPEWTDIEVLLKSYDSYKQAPVSARLR